MKNWKKVLYENQGYEDNYVPPSFLEGLQKNLYTRQYSLCNLMLNSCILYQQLCCIAIFVSLHVYLLWGWLCPFTASKVLFGMCLIGYTSFWIMKEKYERSFSSVLTEIRCAVVFFMFSLVLAPVLHSLLDTLSTDSTHALASGFLLINWLCFDYPSSVVSVCYPSACRTNTNKKNSGLLNVKKLDLDCTDASLIRSKCKFAKQSHTQSWSIPTTPSVNQYSPVLDHQASSSSTSIAVNGEENSENSAPSSERVEMDHCSSGDETNLTLGNDGNVKSKQKLANGQNNSVINMNTPLRKPRPYSRDSTSLTAALLASLCLSSRLPSPLHTFLLVSISISLFALWPLFARRVRCKMGPSGEITMTLILGILGNVLVWPLAVISPQPGPHGNITIDCAQLMQVSSSDSDQSSFFFNIQQKPFGFLGGQYTNAFQSVMGSNNLGQSTEMNTVLDDMEDDGGPWCTEQYCCRWMLWVASIGAPLLLNVIGPWLLLKAQTLRSNIHGPWDEAVLTT